MEDKNTPLPTNIVSYLEEMVQNKNPPGRFLSQSNITAISTSINSLLTIPSYLRSMMAENMEREEYGAPEESDIVLSNVLKYSETVADIPEKKNFQQHALCEKLLIHFSRVLIHPGGNSPGNYAPIDFFRAVFKTPFPMTELVTISCGDDECLRREKFRKKPVHIWIAPKGKTPTVEIAFRMYRSKMIMNVIAAFEDRFLFFHFDANDRLLVQDKDTFTLHKSLLPYHKTLNVHVIIICPLVFLGEKYTRDLCSSKRSASS